MCRLYFNPKPANRGLVGLTSQFEQLERVAGGHGNGVALLNQGRVIKGLNKKSDDLAAAAIDDGGPMMFHTRLASIGTISDQLCQPFKVAPLIVAHNGHWWGWNDALTAMLAARKLSYVPQHLSDSLVGALAARAWGSFVISSYIQTGVWMLADLKTTEPKVMVAVNTGDFCVNLTTGEAASQPVDWVKSDKVGYVQEGSLVALYPELRVLRGGLQKKPIERKKKQ